MCFGDTVGATYFYAADFAFSYQSIPRFRHNKRGGYLIMVAGHLREKKGYFYAVLNYTDAHGNRKTKWIATGIVP